MSELENSPMNTGENPDDYFNQKHLLCAQIEKMGKTTSDRRFKDICVQGFSDEYNDVKMTVFRDPTFDVLQMPSTLRNIFMDAQSRKGSNGRITGRGFAMTTAVSEVVCHDCNETGHIRRNCPRFTPKGKKKTKPAGATKWCAIHNTTAHSDEEYYKQGAKRPEETKEASKAFSACSHCAHWHHFRQAKKRATRRHLSTSPAKRTTSTAASCSLRALRIEDGASRRAPQERRFW
ncbi:unnamed protein product [Sphacelaria rigidula]